MPSEASQNFFKEKLEIEALKFIICVLNCILGPPNLGVRGARPPTPRIR